MNSTNSKRILIHTCCADCALKMLDSIKDDLSISKENISLYYYNPNIHPRTEYMARLEAIKQISKENNVHLIIPDWSPKEYFNAIKFETLKKSNILHDTSIRCPNCWNLRLDKTFEYAKANSYQFISTTLLTSHYQDRDTIITIGKNLAEKYSLNFYIPETICCEIKTAGFYKQNFCGCVYSLTERLEEKYSTSQI